MFHSKTVLSSLTCHNTRAPCALGVGAGCPPPPPVGEHTDPRKHQPGSHHGGLDRFTGVISPTRVRVHPAQGVGGGKRYGHLDPRWPS